MLKGLLVVVGLALAAGALALIAANFFKSAPPAAHGSGEVRSDHFVISYRDIPEEEARHVANTLESHRPRLLKGLGVTNHPPVTVYLHPTQRDFDRATGWKGSKGTSAGPRAIHLSWRRANDKVAIHEFVHTLQLNRLIDYGQKQGWSEEEFEKRFAEQYPRWLWESVSIYLANERVGMSTFATLRRAPQLESFTRENNDIYLVGYTIGEYVVERWGEQKLAELVGAFGDVHGVLGVSVEEFEKGWHDFVHQRYKLA